MMPDDFNAIADETIAVGNKQYKAVVNRTSSRYRDLLPLLGKDDKLCEVFVKKNDVKIGDIFTTNYNEQIVVLEVRECIDRNITHFLGALKGSVYQRKNEVYKQ